MHMALAKSIVCHGEAYVRQSLSLAAYTPPVEVGRLFSVDLNEMRFLEVSRGIGAGVVAAVGLSGPFLSKPTREL